MCVHVATHLREADTVARARDVRCTVRAATPAQGEVWGERWRAGIAVWHSTRRDAHAGRHREGIHEASTAGPSCDRRAVARRVRGDDSDVVDSADDRRRGAAAAAATRPAAGATTTAAGAQPRPRRGGGAAGSNIQASGECGMGTGEEATGDPIKLGGIATNVPGIDFTWITSMTKAYFDCVNDNGGINGRPIEYIVEEEQIDPQQIAGAGHEAHRAGRVLGLVGNTSIIDCSVNGDVLRRAGLLPDHRRRRPGLLHQPELLGREHGPVLLEPRRCAGRGAGRRQGQRSSSSRPTSPASTSSTAASSTTPKQNGMKGVSLTRGRADRRPGRARPAARAGGRRRRRRGARLHRSHRASAAPGHRAAGPRRHGDLGQLDAAERPVGGRGARARRGTASSSSTPSSTCSTRASPTRTT